MTPETALVAGTVISAAAAIGAAGIGAWAMVRSGRSDSQAASTLDEHGRLLTTLVGGQAAAAVVHAEFERRLDGAELVQATCAPSCPARIAIRPSPVAGS